MITLRTELIPAHDDALLADMNGVLPYWGPAGQAAPIVHQPVQRRSVLRSDSLDRDAVAALASTLRGRTWSGTNALMSALLEPGLPLPRKG